MIAPSIPVLCGPTRGHRFASHGVRGSLAIMAGRYEWAVARFLVETLPASAVFFDIGAHTGYFTRLALAVMPADGRIVAFEPDPARRSALETFDPRRVTLRREAVGVRDGTGTLVAIPGACPRLSGSMPESASEPAGAATAVRSLDSLIEAGTVPAPDVLKIDVEGSELDVLAGGAKALAGVRALAVECHNMPIFRDVLDVALEAGFGRVRSTAGGDDQGPPTVLALRAR